MNTRMRELRLAHAMTQLEVARELGVTRQAYSAWEVGASCPSLSAAARVADMFGVTLDCLVGIEAEEAASEVAWLLSDRSELDEEGRGLLRSLVRFAAGYVAGGGR